MGWKQERSPEVFRITAARRGLAEDVRGRQRRYVLSMGVRTVAVLLTVLLWDVQRPLAVVTLVIGTVLPYVAVVIANGGRENPTALPSASDVGPHRPALTAGESPQGRSGPDTEGQVLEHH